MNCMRRHYLDNIRWMTVALVVIYHVIYIYNAVMPPYRRIGAFSETQAQDALLYILYPWFMILLFIARRRIRYYGRIGNERFMVYTNAVAFFDAACARAKVRKRRPVRIVR